MQKLGRYFSELTAFLFRYLPWSVNKRGAQFLTFLWIDVFRIRTNVIHDNIKRVFHGLDEKSCQQIGRSGMFALCRSFFDVMRIPSLSDDWIDQNVVFHGEKYFDEIKNRKEGFFFLSLHLGSGDFAAAIVSRRIKPSTIITKRFKNIFLDSFWFGLREKSETKFINAHAKNNAFEILSHLKQGRGVVFVLDQFMGRPFGLETEFFGIKTGTAYGLALFVKKTQHPVYPLYTYWDEQDKLHIVCEPAIDLTQELSETNEVITNRFNRALEDIITKHPHHWMWVHKRWKTFE